MGKLFDSPVMILIILLMILLLFGAPKLPGMARSLGQSMRIFKSEVKEMKKDNQSSGAMIDNKPAQDSPGGGCSRHPAQVPPNTGASSTPDDP